MFPHIEQIIKVITYNDFDCMFLCLICNFCHTKTNIQPLSHTSCCMDIYDGGVLGIMVIILGNGIGNQFKFWLKLLAFHFCIILLPLLTIGKLLSRLDSLALVRQPVLEMENSEFKPLLLHLENWLSVTFCLWWRG